MMDMEMSNEKLASVLKAHKMWLDGSDDNIRADLSEADLSEANLRGANLRGANLIGANLREANLNGVFGNMIEVKSAQFDTWPITWVMSPDGKTMLQIGCQPHPLDLWRKSDPRWIAAMDEKAAGWWAKYRDIVLALVDGSPATPYGKAE